jgi:hypothetical protein
MDDLFLKLRRADPHRFALAPLLGLTAGFLANRAHGGAIGYVLLAEMMAGALLTTFGVFVLANARAMFAERAAQLARQQASADAQLLAAERARHRRETAVQARVAASTQKVLLLRDELIAARDEGRQLRQSVYALTGKLTARRDSEVSLNGVSLSEALTLLAEQRNLAREAQARIATLEAAQAALVQQQVEIGRKAAQEAEEVKASLLKLSITDSQRLRNATAPENDQSGRIIELEARIKRLARELESLSGRLAASPAQEAGIASVVKAGGTSDNARIGFLQAMLDANKTLRRQISEAA